MEGIAEGAVGVGGGCSSVGVQPRVRLKLCVKKKKVAQERVSSFLLVLFYVFFFA